MPSARRSAIGFSRRSTSALWISVFLIPAEVSKSFMMLVLMLYGEPKDPAGLMCLCNVPRNGRRYWQVQDLADKSQR